MMMVMYMHVLYSYHDHVLPCQAELHKDSGLSIGQNDADLSHLVIICRQHALCCCLLTTTLPRETGLFGMGP